MNTLEAFHYEFKHLTRSRLKVVSILLFCVAAIYGLENGLGLYQEQIEEINKIKIKNEQSSQEVITWFEQGKKGPEERAHIDITKPFWAIWYAPTWALKPPSPMMVFSIGQAEQFGYYKRVTNWSTTFDSDLTGEIANPERLALGALDFGFVVIYLAPILLIILLYNVKGYEKDRDILPLLQVQSTKMRSWLATRLSFYLLIMAGVLLLLMLIYGWRSSAFSIDPTNLFSYYGLSLFYLFIWTLLCYFILNKGSGSTSNAVAMISIWLTFCLLAPAFVHQLATIKYPSGYMLDFIDAGRDELYDLYDLPQDTLEARLLSANPALVNSKAAKDSLISRAIINNSMSYLANQLMKKASEKIEENNEQKNSFIKDSYWYNPVTFFHNALNAICATDYYAYQDFRKDIQTMIDKKSGMITLESWNKETVNKEKFLHYLEVFAQ